MYAMSSFELRNVHYDHAEGNRSSGKAFEFVVGLKADVAHWLDASYANDSLQVKIWYNDITADYVNYRPEGSPDLQEVIGILLFIANYQMLMRRAFATTYGTYRYEASEEITQEAAGRFGWVTPELPTDMRRISYAALALSLTFGLDANKVMDDGYQNAVEKVVAAGFDTNRLLALK